MLHAPLIRGAGHMAFSIKDGQIISAAGKPWRGYGINFNDEQADEVVAGDDLGPLIQLFPGLGFVRLAFHSYTDPATQSLRTLIRRLSAKGTPILCEDHTGISAGPYTGARLDEQNAWMAAVARQFGGNDFVWIGTLNEPSDKNIPAISVQQQSNYNAIRATGSRAIIAMELPGGGNPGTIGAGHGMDPAVYAKMTNIVWDLHYYGWVSGYSTDQAKVNAALAGDAARGIGIAAAQSIRSADGLVPVILGEFGDSTNGNSVDANWAQVIEAVKQTKLPSTAWAWRPGGRADILTIAGQVPVLTTPFGQRIAALIKANSQVTPVTPSAPYTQLTKPSDAPIIDNAGNTWGLIAADGQQITINGNPDTQTRNVALVKWVPPLVWQSNIGGGAWSCAGPGQPWLPGTMPITPTTPSRASLQAKLDQAMALISEVHVALDNPLP